MPPNAIRKVLCPHNAIRKFLCPPNVTISAHLPGPLFGRTASHSMKSVEAREHLVQMVREQGHTVASAVRNMNVPVRSNARFLTYFLDTGGEFHYWVGRMLLAAL